MPKTYYVTAKVVYRVEGDNDLTEKDAIRAVNREEFVDIESIEVLSIEGGEAT